MEQRRSVSMMACVAAIVGCFCSVLCGSRVEAEARIYVIKQADGTIRFTNRQPPSGARAQVFTARSTGVSFYRSRSGRPGQIFPNLYNEIIRDVAREHAVDPALIKAVIHAESAFNPRAVSPKGARGLMQLMPGTARDLGVWNSFAPESNIRGGTAYLAQLLRRFGKIEHAIAAYNAGAEPVEKFNGIPPYSETQDYVRRVLQLKKQYSSTSHG